VKFHARVTTVGASGKK